MSTWHESNIGLQVFSFKLPLLPLGVEFCMWVYYVCVYVRNFEVKYLGIKPKRLGGKLLWGAYT